MLSGKLLRQILDKMMKVQDACSMLPKLYEGKNIRELAAWGLKLDACCSGYDSCFKVFDLLGA
jgi:hypothetical protein